ncbi:MAG: efflux RND transporter periplasmic adaptor subunit [Deltaproteobacteria bacterium]|nr:efflux RND transporter periplasmic adaptor subunit [Deltaproteobacteria bacterium]
MHSHVLHDAWAEYRRAQADLTRRLAEFAHAEKTVQRAERLYRDKAISFQELSRVQVERTAAEQMLNAAKAEVRRTEEALEHLGLSPLKHAPRGEAGEQIPVTSPLAGAVLEKHATSGTAVTPGMPLFVVSDLSTLWALAEIDETQLSQMKVGLPVALRVAAYPQESFPGTVVFIGDMLDPKTRRVTVRCSGGGRRSPGARCRRGRTAHRLPSGKRHDGCSRRSTGALSVQIRTRADHHRVRRSRSALLRPPTRHRAAR